MFWNERERRWERHPMCRCEHDPCYCRNLPPLDREGRPIGEVLIPTAEQVEDEPRQRRRA